MIFHRRFLAILVCCVPLVLGGCSLPRFVGLGPYYAITDNASGRVYYSDNLSREKKGVVEFRDSTSGVWVSIPSATVRQLTQAEFRAGPAAEAAGQTVSDQPVSGQ